jgi:site-specific recombinase XerD
MLVEHRLVRRDLPQLIDLKEFIDSDCLIEASSDLEAVYTWLDRFDNEHTIKSYSRDATRFLLWLGFVKGKHLAKLLLDDIHDYIEFLQNPDPSWCMNKKKLRRYDLRWRPFSKPLSKRSVHAAIAVLKSLFNFLENAGYIAKNPVKLLKLSSILGKIQDQKYHVQARMLEADEWEAVIQALKTMPSDTFQACKYKARANLLFCMLYILGLRISEASNTMYNNFRRVDGRWWFYVQGKGDKLGSIPVNDTMLQALQNFRHIYEISSTIETDTNFIFVNEDGEKLNSRSLYNIVKTIGEAASCSFADDEDKCDKLLALSPHWLRHLSASHQDKRGVPLTMIRDNHRHASINTTQIYMHSEDVARHRIMQEHSLSINTVIHQRVKEFFITITFTKGGLDKNAAFNSIKNTIETKILENHMLVSSNNKSLEYKLKTPASSFIIDSIKMLCKIWMFEVNIEHGAIC